MKKSWLLICIGFLLLINAIFGRFIVLPGFLSSLDAGKGSIEAAAQEVPLWKIFRYLLWAYSFKLGVFSIGIGVLLKSSIRAYRLRIIFIGGILYILLAYAPVPGPFPIFFGISGSVITLLMVLIFFGWMRDREHLEGKHRSFTDYRLIGYFFFAMATYNLCPLMGIKAFGLYPEKMIRYGLQSEAAAFASRIMIELVLAWLFIFISYRKSLRDHIG